MKCNPAGISLIQSFESFSPTAYPDPASELAEKCRSLGLRPADYAAFPAWKTYSGQPWTIGWGETGPNIGPGLVWTREYADKSFAKRLEGYEMQLAYLLRSHKITSNQFSALVSFAYNVGMDDMPPFLAHCEKITPNTIAKSWRLKELDPEKVKNRLPRYNKARGRVLKGLVRRRAAELALFLKD